MSLRLNVVVSWTLALATAALAQAPQPPQFRGSSNLVEVYVTATSRDGRGVHDLRGDEFEIYEDGQRRDVAVFSAMVQPVSVALVLDHSGSTAAQFAKVRQASEAFLERLFEDDRAALSTLWWDCVAFTNDRRLLAAALRGQFPRDAGSPIWSGVTRAMSALASERGRRVILVLSDGNDNQPVLIPRAPSPSARDRSGCVPADVRTPVTLTNVMDRAERDTVMIYTVAVPSSETAATAVVGDGAPKPMATLGSNLPPRGTTGYADLTRLARRSGGSSHELTDYSQLQAVFKHIADEVHLQYLLGFVPGHVDGKRHEIRVKVKRDGVTIRARESYIGGSRR